MDEGMTFEVRIDPELVHKLPLRRTTPYTTEEYHRAEAGETFPVSLDEFVNNALRRYPTPEEQGEGMRKLMLLTGKKLGYPGYREAFEEEYGG